MAKASVSVRRWIQRDFRRKVREVADKVETQALLKVGHDQGEPLGTILAKIATSIVLEIAGVEPEEPDLEEIKTDQVTPPPCVWVWDDCNYVSGCGRSFQFYYDGPRENGFAFCPYCGRELEAESSIDDPNRG